MSAFHTVGHILSSLPALDGLADVPNPGSGTAPAKVGDKVLVVLGWVAWLATAACVAGIITTAAKMAIAHRRGDDTNVSALGWVLGASILIGAASSIVGVLVQ